METQQTPINELIVKLAKHTHYTMLGDSQIRRDNSIKQQLYFMPFAFTDEAKHVAVNISQAFCNQETNQVEMRELHKVLLDGFRKGCVRWYGICILIDEVSKLLYFIYNHIRVFKITIYDLSFSSQEDKLGYRAVTVKDNPRSMVIQQNQAVLKYDLFLLDQSRGQILTTCVSVRDPDCHLPAVIQFTKGGLSAEVVPGKGKFINKSKEKRINVNSLLLSREGHLLTLYLTDTRKNAFLCSYNRKLELVKFLKLDIEQLLMDCFLPVELHSYDELQLLGHIGKYVIFLFGIFVLAIKWPKDWYMRSKQLPAIRFVTQSLNAPDKGYRPPFSLLGTDLYCLTQTKDGYTLTRARLGPRLSNYHECAHCNKRETHKRRNKDGKRVSNFKVCRMCKEKNRHTYYCSLECVKAQWKDHKLIHEQEE